MDIHSRTPVAKMFGIVQARPVFAALLLGLALAVTACASQQEAPQQDTGPRISERGSFPNWSVREMVERSDAVVIATLEVNLGSKGIPGAHMESVSYVRLFTDYKVAVEQVLYVRDGTTPKHLALLTHAGIVPTSPGSHVEEIEGFPAFQTGERVLLFLTRVSAEQLQLEPEHFVPRGFTLDEYYRPRVSALYGKLVPQGSNWKDSRTGKPVTMSEIQQAIAAVKRAQ